MNGDLCGCLDNYHDCLLILWYLSCHDDVWYHPYHKVEWNQVINLNSVGLIPMTTTRIVRLKCINSKLRDLLNEAQGTGCYKCKYNT